jgi:predicted kinase
VTTLAVPGRVLLLVAGLPGAGKSTLLRALPPRPGLRVLDSDAYRDWLRGPLGSLGSLPYTRYRWLVHLWHRLAVLVAALSTVRVVVVHLPATGARTRAAVAALAALTGRTAHLVWLDVPPEQALRGQRERGRVVPGGSFAGHVQRAAATSARLRPGGAEPGWATVTVLDRARAATGLRLHTAAPVEHARSRPQ